MGTMIFVNRKPTKAQMRVFNEMMGAGEFRCVDSYKPALALVDMGLAQKIECSYGTLKLIPTDLARKAAG